MNQQSKQRLYVAASETKGPSDIQAFSLESSIATYTQSNVDTSGTWGTIGCLCTMGTAACKGDD